MSENRQGENLPAIIPTPEGTLVPDWWERVHGSKLFLTSIDLTAGHTAKRRLIRHLQETAQKSDSWINKQFNIIDRTFVPVQSGDEDGEVSNYIRTVVETDKGELIAFGSRGIVKSITLLESLERPAPWNPPLKVELISTPIAGNRRWLEFRPIYSDDKSVAK